MNGMRTVAIIVLLVLSAPAMAPCANPEQETFAPNTEVADIPTASTLYARMFNLNFRAFRGGGILAKATASFNNSLMLGVAVKANNVIGAGGIDFDNEPVKAVAKLKLINMAGSLVGSVGYDGMSYDRGVVVKAGVPTTTDLTRAHGLYGVLSNDLAMGGIMLQAHAGAGANKFKGFKSSRDLNAFLGVSGALSEQLTLGLEYDDMLNDHGYVNACVGYAWDVGLRLELDFKSLFRGVQNSHRLLKILYTF